jgi:UDP-N-acetylglucosamine 2-epimerase (hydrolysing)
MRHATSKMSHIHFVSNASAKKRLIQMGELSESIAVIGSPDVDIMFSNSLPSLEEAKHYYEINFEQYAIAMFHPVTTEVKSMQTYANNFVEALLKDDKNYVIVYPNNDMGSQSILDAYQPLKKNKRFRIFPSLRFEYFLTLLKNAQFMIGNSSAGVREAPYYGLPVINIGSRQQNRVMDATILNVGYDTNDIVQALKNIMYNESIQPKKEFGAGNSAKLFLKSLQNTDIWQLNHQKQFRDIK